MVDLLDFEVPLFLLRSEYLTLLVLVREMNLLFQLNLIFLYKVSFSAVSSRFWGAESKSDECQTGTLERFRQNAKIQDGRHPAWQKY